MPYVDLVSTAGGEPSVDGVHLSDPIQRAFTDDPEMQRKSNDTPGFVDVDAADYDAVLFADGHGAMWDFPNDPDLAHAAREIYEAGDAPCRRGVRSSRAGSSFRRWGVSLWWARRSPRRTSPGSRR